MSYWKFAVGVVVVCAVAAGAPLDTLLKGVEARYNHTRTLEVLFTEQYTPPGKARRMESGTLLLRKPGRMRWDYSQPAGKLFISDGKMLWLYTPAENRVEKMKFQETEDMRAPLAFLLGKLHFDKEFRNLQARPDGTLTRVTAEPKTDNLPYSAVEFAVTSDKMIREVKVTGFDKSILDFTFDHEKVDPPLADHLFEFEMPKGAELVEAGQ